MFFQSFYRTPLTLGYLPLQAKEKFWVLHASASRLWDVYLSVPKNLRKNDISGSIWHKLFIKMVKYSFPDERIVYHYQ